MLSNCDFRQNEEPNATVKIRIAKEGILANQVVFKITPLTVTKAESLGIMNFTRPGDEEVSPSIAGKSSTIIITYYF